MLPLSLQKKWVIEEGRIGKKLALSFSHLFSFLPISFELFSAQSHSSSYKGVQLELLLFEVTDLWRCVLLLAKPMRVCQHQLGLDNFTCLSPTCPKEMCSGEAGYSFVALLVGSSAYFDHGLLRILSDKNLKISLVSFNG